MSVRFTAVPGFFIQDNPSTDPTSTGALPERFGLLDNSPERWTTFRDKIDQLNESAPKGTSYKVFFLGRHGQGHHNVAEAKYGTQAWDDDWSKLNGDDELTWGPDPLLTSLGESQALDARAAWKVELKSEIPLPQRFYCSPLKRALDTWAFTFSGSENIAILPTEQRKVQILENCREEYGDHTCDLRSSLSTLKSLYPPPVYSFEPHFPEHDPVWKPDEREAKSHIALRATAVLNTIFTQNDTYVSITSHGGFINGFLAAIGRTSYALPTGGVLPVVVKGTVAPQGHTDPTISEY